MSEIYICANCGDKCRKSIPDQQAIVEYETRYKKEWKATDVVLVCTDCYNRMQLEQTEKPVVQ